MIKTLMFFSAMCIAFCGTVTHAEVEDVKAPKGGNIKPLDDGYIEVVNARNSIKIYLYDKNLKAQKQLKAYSIVAEVQRATSKEHESLELKRSAEGFTADFESGNASKYYLDLGIANRKSGRADRVSFDIEFESPEQKTAATP